MRYHLCLDVRGALLNWSNRELAVAITHNDGRKMTAREARMALMDELAKGRKVIPCAPCDNFDYQHGCQGHEEPTEVNSTVNNDSPDGETRGSKAE